MDISVWLYEKWLTRVIDILYYNIYNDVCVFIYAQFCKHYPTAEC